MMNRLLGMFFLLTMLLLAANPTHTAATGPEPSPDFDRGACYAKCPCQQGILSHDCAACKQRCDWELWRHLGERAKKKGS
jgi:hypothetical protein